MIVRYYADSLGMPRPGTVEMNQRYINLFLEWLKGQVDEEVYLFDRARGSSTIMDLYNSFNNDQDYFSGDKDILIIHDGVVDCAPRPIPVFLRRIISRLPAGLRKPVVEFIHTNRAKMLDAGFRYHFTSKKRFEKTFTEWLTSALRSFSKIYIINIAPTTPEIEKHSPGFTSSIQEYNAIIQQVIDQVKSPKICLLDAYNILLTSNQGLYRLILQEDGHHITPLAHSLYAEQLISLHAQEVAVNA